MSLLLFSGLFTYGLPSSRGGVYLRCLGVYLRCYRLHGGCGFEFTSGGSCGRACIIPPKILGHLPPVGQRCLPAVLWVVYLRSSVLAGRCLPAVLTSTCGAFGCLPPVGQRYLCLTAWGVYLRWFRLHSAGVRLSIPPVAPADVPAIPAQEFGTSTCGATRTITCGAETRLPSGGCIPAVRLFAFNF